MVVAGWAPCKQMLRRGLGCTMCIRRDTCEKKGKEKIGQREKSTVMQPKQAGPELE